MHIKTTHAAEDYLKVIYEMTRSGGRASTNGIAARMAVSAASATGMIQKLAASEPPLVDYEKHRGVDLTPEGEQVALEIIRHHRLLETYLHEKLGYGWDEVHEEADRLEHVISEELEERIALALGDPVFDPHGEPIPSREFQVPDQSIVPLSELEAEARATVRQIEATDPGLLRYLAGIGLLPGSLLTVLERSPFDGNLRIRVEGHKGELVLGPKVTERIFVEVHAVVNDRAGIQSPAG